VLRAILQMLIAERFKFIVMEATASSAAGARLHRFRLEMKLSDDDLPTESPQRVLTGKSAVAD
jgi:hypothetical protein